MKKVENLKRGLLCMSHESRKPV